MSDPNLGSFRPNPSSAGFDQSGLVTFLRQQHPTKTADHVSALCGVSVDTVRNWLKGRNHISITHSILLVAVYGPDALKAMWSGALPGWLDVAVQDEALARNEAEFHRLAAERAAITSQKVGP